MKYSLIIPLYNRPEELDELLHSLLEQHFKDFEVIIVEDGSTDTAEQIAKSYSDKLEVKYFYKPNEGQGFTRNYGMKRASGDYFIILDSDCIIPAHYLKTVDDEVNRRQLDLFGGPDAAHDSFTPIQKAISYSMTSFFTTGGIRGRKKHVGPYHPRSFNMGISRDVFEKVGGFKITRMGEDIEWSIRIIQAGFKSGLIEDAFVYHKRRTDFKRFFKQIFYFGRARINIESIVPGSLKLVHFFPVVFLLGIPLTIGLLLFLPKLGLLTAALYLFFSLAVTIDSSIKHQSLNIGILSLIAAWIQMTAYGSGLLYELWRRKVLLKKTHLEYYPE